MDVHKPKPWHSVREFLKEYLIIVVGVLTALGAEQVAENLHEQKIASEARESVRAEVRENLWWLKRRERREACVGRQIDELEEVLDAARHGRPYPTPRHLERVYHVKLTSLRWEANAQAGRASLFTTREQRNLGNMYYTTEQFGHYQDLEEDVWSKLDAIVGLDRLTPSEIDAFALLLAQARYQHSMIDLSLRRAQQWAAALQLKAENPNLVEMPTASVVSTACASISMAPSEPS